jgi:hypothetical protein
MISKKKAGMTAEQIRAERSDAPVSTDVAEAPPPVAAEPDGGQEKRDWTVYGWLSGENSDERRADVGSGGQVVPKGIESRLRTLQRLNQEGLITDEEYAAKRAEILGQL